MMLIENGTYKCWLYEPELNLNSTEQSKMAGFYEHGTEVVGFKKQTPCGPALQQSTLHERKILSIQ